MSKKSIDKYIRALQELRFVLSYNENFSMDHFCRVNKIGKSFTQSAISNNIINKISKGKYKWISKDDININMAVNVLDGVAKRNGYNKSRKLNCNLNFDKELYTKIAKQAVSTGKSFNEIVENILNENLCYIPDIYEVKEYFKNAKRIQNNYGCVFDFKGEITEKFPNQYWITDGDHFYTLWDKNKGYAKIIEYKD